jgi:hypothetical protein
MAIRADSIGGIPHPGGVGALLRKDLAVFRSRDRFLILLIYLLGHPTVLPNEEAFFWLGVGLVGALALYVPAVEWHQETDQMLSSLPVSRATVVFSRYISSIVSCALGAGAWVSTGSLLGPVLGADGAVPGMWATLPGITAFVSVAILLLSLFLPLYFRYGLGKGAMIFVPSVMGLYLLSIQSRGFAAPATAVRDGVEAFSASVGPGWVLFLILLLLAAMVAASGRLSVRWFEKRDL